MRVSSVVSWFVCFMESRFYNLNKDSKKSIEVSHSFDMTKDLDFNNKKVDVSRMLNMTNDLDSKKNMESNDKSVDCHALPCDKSYNDNKNIESRFYKGVKDFEKKGVSIESRFYKFIKDSKMLGRMESKGVGYKKDSKKLLNIESRFYNIKDIIKNIESKKPFLNLKTLAIVSTLVSLQNLSAFDINCITNPVQGCVGNDYINRGENATNAVSNNIRVQNNIEINTLRMRQFLLSNTAVELGLKGSGKVTIQNMTNNHNAGIFSTAYTARLFSEMDTYIGSINHINRGGGSVIHVRVDKNLEVGKTQFAENGVAGSQGKILLEGHDIKINEANSRTSQILQVNASGNLEVNSIKFQRLTDGDAIILPLGYAAFTTKGEAKIGNIEGFGSTRITIDAEKDIKVQTGTFKIDACITYSCQGIVQLNSKTGNVYVNQFAGGNANESGIGAFNRFKVMSGGNFYAGKIDAVSLTTSLNNSYFDLNEVQGDIFVDYAQFRGATMYGDNFHFNTLYVMKANANRVGFEHPTGGSAYSKIETNIGNSFINYLSMQLGTSHTADFSALWLSGGGQNLTMNYIDARGGSYINMQSIENVHLDTLNTTGSAFYLKNGIFNNIVAQRPATWISTTSHIEANALNINESLHLKNGSTNGGPLDIVLNKNNYAINQNFDNYLKLDIDSNALKAMDAGEIQSVVTKAENGITTTNHKNQSGIYVTTSDNKHYLVLPGIKTEAGLEGYQYQITAKNEGNLLIEQTELKTGTLRNFGVIMLDNMCNESTKLCITANPSQLTINGDVDNLNTIDVGAGSKTLVNGNVYNNGNLIFRVQSDVNNLAESRNGQLVVNDGSFNIDVSPGKVGGMRADITSANSLANLRLKKDGDAALNTNTYRLVEVNNARINYVYTYGDYTTTFTAGLNGQASINTIKNNGEQCNNADCETNVGNDTSQETKWTQGGLKNPWDMEKSQVDSNNGGKVEKPLGENMNNDSILGRPNDSEIKIEKPSQADKYADCKANGYCGFGNDKNATEAERGYDYAIERMKNSFTITYQGGNIDGKYLQVEKVVTPQVIGFNVIKKEIFNPSGSEIPLCNSESSSFDCVLYMEAGGNNSWINALKKESKNSYNILKDLFYNENSELLMLIQLDQSLAISRNLDYFLEVGRTLDTTMQHVSSLENKSSTLQTLNLAMDSAKSNRLARVAYFQSPEYEALAFQEYQANVERASELASQVRALRNNYAFNSLDSKGVKVAVVDSIESNSLDSKSDVDSNSFDLAAVANHHSNTETIYDTADNTDSNNNEAWFNTIADLIVRFSTRGENPNNLWANAIGNVSFSTTGSNQLYGFNAGYDYYSKLLHTAFGLYVGYGYGIFTGNNNGYISNNSQNLFAGIYTRTFIGNNEFDMTISASRGFVNESIQAQKRGFDLLDLFNQKYHYNVTNLEGNVTYGYAFILKKGYTLKPFLGASYYISTSTGYNRQASGIFEIDTSDNARHAIGVNVGIEGRKYFKNQSYIFLNAQFRQDVYVLKNNLDSKRLSNANVSNTESNLAFTFDYRGDSLRSNMFITAGGELALGRFYINTSLTSHTSVISKAFGFGANAGIRFIF